MRIFMITINCKLASSVYPIIAAETGENGFMLFLRALAQIKVIKVCEYMFVDRWIHFNCMSKRPGLFYAVTYTVRSYLLFIGG